MTQMSRLYNLQKYKHHTYSEVLETIGKKCGKVQVFKKSGEGKQKVIFLPEATDEMRMVVSYGRRSPMNYLEQKFQGYGHIFTDGDAVIIVVKHIIEIPTMNRTRVSASNLDANGNNPGLDFLEYYREEFLRYEKQFNTDAFGNLVDPYADEEASVFVVEAHTHPDLGVFFSGPDRNSGKIRASYAPICTLVCDPIRETILASVGKELEPAEVLLLERKRQEQSSEQPSLHNEGLWIPPRDKKELYSLIQKFNQGEIVRIIPTEHIDWRTGRMRTVLHYTEKRPSENADDGQSTE